MLISIIKFSHPQPKVAYSLHYFNIKEYGEDQAYCVGWAIGKFKRHWLTNPINNFAFKFLGTGQVVVGSQAIGVKNNDSNK